MINPSAKSATQVELLPPVSAANTALGTGGWVDCRTAVGDIMVIQAIGACAGTVLGTFETSPYANGASNVAVVPAGGALVAATANTANQIQKTFIDSSQNLGWLKYIGTVTTGPILLGVTAHFHPKYTT